MKNDNRKNKRILAVILTLLMTMSMTCVSFAEAAGFDAEAAAAEEQSQARGAESASGEVAADEDAPDADGDAENMEVSGEEGNAVQSDDLSDEEPAAAGEGEKSEGSEEDDLMNVLGKNDEEGSTTPDVTFDESKYRVLTNRKVTADKLDISLRSKLGESYGGYAVAQGAATDGTYAYYMMASSSTQHGRVLKVRIRDNKVMGKSEVLSEVHHGNGMTYDSKRNRLVVVGYGKWRHKLTYIDPDTLTVKPPEGKTQKQPSVKYSYVDDMKGVPNGAENNGIAAIAYVSKYDVYVARSRGRNSSYAGTTGSANNNLWVFDAETLEAIGHIYTKVTSKYPATYQSMDADEKYVYFLLSPGSGQKKNIILALDWNSEQLLPVVNRKEETDPAFVDTMWKCGTDGSPDAVVTIPISHESEGLFHTTDADGNEHFYVSEYYGRWKYKTVTKKKKYKVKWKKVKKKVKVKGKTKYKKVWKYKTKYKKVKVRKKVAWMRDDYVYDLGVI